MSTQATSSTASRERQRSPRLYIVLLMILCVLFIAGYLQRLTTLGEVQQQIAAMHARIVVSEQRKASLQMELARVQNTEYVASLARDEMGLVQEGDLPIVVYDVPPPAEAVETRAPTTAPSSEKPIWQQWLDLLLPDVAR